MFQSFFNSNNFSFDHFTTAILFFHISWNIGSLNQSIASSKVISTLSIL
ncbi:hypothetical protein HOF65_00970 [bacterium]|nr:hypothetical protein [bacterium]MBT3852614.1 hypothetical protein [bacterium]